MVAYAGNWEWEERRRAPRSRLVLLDYEARQLRAILAEARQHIKTPVDEKAARKLGEKLIDFVRFAYGEL